MKPFADFLRGLSRAGSLRRAILTYRFFLAWGFTCSLLLAGCASGISEKERDAEAPPAVEKGGYKIGVDDRVQVSVWRNPELTVIVPVRPDGMISVPLIGDVQAGGKTAPELAAFGPHTIGVRTLTVSGANRVDILTTKADGPVARYTRSLALEVWYPAQLAPSQEPCENWKVPA